MNVAPLPSLLKSRYVGVFSVPSWVIVTLPIICCALSMTEGIVICAKVITDANPRTIVKNKRTRFLTDRLLDQTL